MSDVVCRLGCAAVLIPYVALVVYGSLTPFEFDPVSLGALRDGLLDLLIRSWRLHSRRDLVINVLLFVPIGLAGPAVVFRRAGWRGTTELMLTASLTLSVSLELAQRFVPGRISTMTDVLAQTLGTVIGIAGHGALAFVVARIRAVIGSDRHTPRAD